MNNHIPIIVLALSTIAALCPFSDAHAQSIDSAEADTCQHLSEVTVTGFTGSTHIRTVAAPVTFLSHTVLAAHPSTNIIATISRLPGINQVTPGGAISKPVIRGLGYNRVLVVNDGIRQEGQQWGDEHGIEIDGNDVHTVEVMKGPASLMYGSDAMAGVIIMHGAPVMQEGTMFAEAAAGYQTNNGLADYTVNFRGNQNGLVWNGRWSQKWAHDYHAPLDGYVPNSRFREQALSGMLGVNKHWGYTHLKGSYYHLSPGMTEVEDEYEEGSTTYALSAPFQQVTHSKAVLDNHFNLGSGYLKAVVGYQLNRRQEYEEAEERELDFRLRTLNYDLRYVLPNVALWNLNFGVNGMWQSSANLGEECLIPAYYLLDAGAFATFSRTFYERLHLSGGLRYDFRRLHSLALDDDGEERFFDFRRRFRAVSGSVGAIYNVSDCLDVKVNASRGFRAPNMSELGSNGTHEGTFRYELGNPELQPEFSWQFDAGADYASRYVSASCSLFANRITNYIFLQRTAAVADGMPVYAFNAGDARIMGGEARIILHLLHHLHFENSFSYVDARQMHVSADSRYLPFTPAPRWIATLHYDVPLSPDIVRGLFAEISTDYNFRQSHVMTAGNTERPTSAYVLLDFSLGTDFHLPNGRKLCSLSISGTNMTNNAYQSHLSRLKYADTFALTGRNGINNMGRNVCFRLTFPLSL